MIVVDTTVLTYAKGADHLFREPCRRLVDAVRRGDVDATTTPEVIQEFTDVRGRRRDRSDAVALAGEYVDVFAPLFVVDESYLSEGLRLFHARPRLGAFDAVLAAAARASGADALVSADAAFGDVPRLTHVVPDDAGLDSLMG
jgi:predicted nucleic acid-binding protein